MYWYFKYINIAIANYPSQRLLSGGALNCDLYRVSEKQVPGYGTALLEILVSKGLDQGSASFRI